MIPELGNFALILALCLAIAQAVFALAGAHTGKRVWMAVARPAAAGQFVFVAVAFVCLLWAFLQHDFSVLYVATNSNSELPVMYRVSAIWGAHEGSLLLWILVLTIWTVAVSVFSRGLPERFAVRVIGVMGLISIGFLLFTLATSNPFERLQPAALDGRDLNPLLQDPALAIHPPMLYIGYVGFSVAFAFALAAMLEGRLDATWARWTRPWTTAAWCFLTVGIALGSWWAYYELGWGGWWFWDPVENASFMPWLVGTALIHSLAVTEKRGLFTSWTLLLAIAAFSLSLLGTFLVRSGVLVSVHSFATDPERGLFILMFLAVTIGGALTLYAWRAPGMNTRGGFQPLSRETFLMANNVLLVVAALVILLGTLYPLFLDALGGGKISVGPPYFDLAFMIPIVPLILAVGVGMHTTWRSVQVAPLWRRLAPLAAIALIAGIAVPWLVYGSAGALTVVGCTSAFWVMLSAAAEPVRRIRVRGLRGVPRGVLGMSLAHFGLGVFILGVTVTNSFSVERDTAVRVGDSVTAGDYRFVFGGVQPATGPNYEATEAEVAVFHGDKQIAVLRPQERVYRVQRNPMTESDIDSALVRDLYVALGDDLGGGAWSMRVQYKPMVRLIWFGALIMAIAGGIALSDPRYRTVRSASTASDAATATEPA